MGNNRLAKTAAVLQSLLLAWSALAPAAQAAVNPVKLIKSPSHLGVTAAPPYAYNPRVALGALDAGALRLTANALPVVSVVPVAVVDAPRNKTSALQNLVLHSAESLKLAATTSVASAKTGSEGGFFKAAFGLAFGLTGEESSSSSSPQDMTAKRRELTLDNGLKVLLVNKPGLHHATIAVGYAVGGRDESSGELGYAHFLEHLMYQGTKNVRNWFRAAAMTGGTTNAFTRPDDTVHVQTVPRNMLEEALFLAGEQMQNFEITPEKVEREKRTILQERRGAEGSEYFEASLKLNELVYTNPRNRTDVIGPEESIQSASAEKLQAFFDSHYTLQKANLVVTGSFDLDQVEALVRRRFGSIPARSSTAPETDLTDNERSGLSAEVEDSAAVLPAVLFDWKAPSYGTPGFYAADIAAVMLNLRLHKRLVLNEQSAASVVVSVPYLQRDPVHVQGSIMQTESLSAEQALAALQAEVAALARGEFTLEELRDAVTARTQNASAQLLAADNSAWHAIAAMRGMGEAELKKDIERWSWVSREQVLEAARAVFAAQKRSTVKVTPRSGKKSATKTAVSHDRVSRVDETPTSLETDFLTRLARRDWPELDYEAPSEFVLPNGLKVVVLPDSRTETTFAKLAFKIEATVAAKDRSMLPFVTHLLNRRSAGLNEDDIDGLLQRMGSWLNAGTMDFVVFDAAAPAGQQGLLLGLIAEVVSRPRAWTAEELAPLKAWYKQVISQDAGSSVAASHKRALKDLLGDGHPSANADLTPEAVDALTPEDFTRLVKTHFVPDNAVLVLTGKVDPELARQNLSGIFADWKPSGRTVPAAGKASALPQGKISLVDFGPNFKNPLLRVSGVADASPESPDYYPLLVANQILGGGLASRLWQTLRQSLGYAYSTASEIITEPGLAVWTATLTTRLENAPDALAALLEQIESMRERKADEIELAIAKNALRSSFWVEFGYPGSIGNQLMSRELFGQPAATWGEFVEKVSAVTAEDVLRVSRKLFDPEKTAVTVVGSAEALREDLARIKPVSEYDADGKPKDPPRSGLFAGVFGR